MNHEEMEGFTFDLPKNKSNVIKVIGVGGGGGNAIKHMYAQGITGVDFIICNTDAQALDNSPVPNRIQLGASLTEGLGAGANPEVGAHSAQESEEAIRAMLDTNTKMVFITAGMGGGTGTGAAPVIAKVARDLDILTVGIVTIPFQFEGKVRNEQAQLGIEKLRANVDSLIIINNNKLREVYGNLGFKAGFSKADEVLATAARGIAEVITHHYTQNIDLRDAKTVLSNSGTAIMGSSMASGEGRAQEAILRALDSPLLNDNKIRGAKNVLLLIVSGSEEITIDEIAEINDHIQTEAGGSANIIMGVGEDEELGNSIAVTVIATGFNKEQQNEISNTEAKRIIHTLDDEQKAHHVISEKPATSPNGVIIMDLDDYEEPVIINEPVVITKNDFVEKETPSVLHVTTQTPEKIVHELIAEEEFVSPIQRENALIPTTEFIKNLNVIYEEVLDFQEPTLTTRASQQTETFVDDEQNLFTFNFDMPQNTAKESQTKNPTDHSNLKEIVVNEAIEFIPVTELNEQGVTKYSLDDYMDFEESLIPVRKVAPAVPKVTPSQSLPFYESSEGTSKEQVPHVAESREPLDVTDMPINEVLKLRAEERKAKMHLYNYKFKNSHRQEELESKPAFQRQGIELNDNVNEFGRSRTTLSVDDKDGVQLRTNNNSFLHDNVD